jgi:nucleoid-associated protein YgaU
MKYPAIFDANRNILENPDVIHPGQELNIPNL